MFERFLAVPLHFTIEFLGFLVVAGGAFLVPSRPSLVPGTKTNRIVAATGFAVLAAAQVLHGGAFTGAEGDGAQLLLAIKTIGFALILMGIMGAARPTSGAFVAQGTTATTGGVVEFLPAASAAVVALMTVLVSRRGAKELRRLALGLLLIAAAEALVPLIETENTARLAGGYELASHLTRTAGYFLMAAWLWTGVRSSIRTRFVASFVILLLVVVLALSSALTGVIANNVERSELDNVSDQVASVQSALGGSNLRAMAQQVQGAASSLNVICSLAESLPECPNPSLSPGGAASATQSDRLIKADAVLLLNRRGKLAGVAGHGGSVSRRKVEPLGSDDQVAILGSGPVQVVLTSPSADSSVDVVRVGDSAAVVGVSRVPPTGTGRSEGTLVLVDFLDFLTVDDIRRNAGAEASLVVGRNVKASTLGRGISASNLAPSSVRDDLEFSSDGIVAEPQTLEGDTYYSAVTVLQTDAGFPVAYLVLSSPSRIVTTAREDVTRTLFLVALGVGAIVLLLAYYSGSRITRPIQTLTDTAHRIREGDLKAQADVAGEDEVGQLGETFNEMTSSLFRMTNDLRKAARDEHQLRSQVEAIIESMADGLVAVGADGTVIAFNREAEQITGLRAKSVTGKPIRKVLDARDSNGEKVSLPIFDLAEGSVGGIYIQRKGTDPVPVSIVSAALRTEEGETDGGVAVVRDMTREREVERMKSEFLSNISHELRTPLTPIKGYAEILDKKEVPPAKLKQFTRGILDSTAKLERIVELLVDFSALEAGRLSPRSASVDLAAMVEKLAADWEKRTPRHTVVADVGAGLPQVVGDERLLRRSLEEILDNAVKFSPEGGTITLAVEATSRQNGDERRRSSRSVDVTVSDEGIGIPAEDVPKIFSDFHQLDGSETRSYGGLGLGLAFVRRIVEAHDGSVSVESQIDQGTRLRVSLPAAKTSKARVATN